MRLLMIYIISQEGIRDDDRRRLMDAAGLSPDDQAAIVNLFYLGVTLSRGASKATASRRKTAGGAKGSDAASYDLSRYTPVLKRLVEDVLTNAAPLAAFPYVKDRPASAASAGAGATISPADVSLDAARRPGAQPEPSWATRGRSKKEDASTAGPRLVVFVLGGATYSELKCCYELAKVRVRVERCARRAARAPTCRRDRAPRVHRRTSERSSQARRRCSHPTSSSTT